MSRIFITGDLHGDRYYIKNIINKINNPSVDDFLIVCGDAGFEYEEYVMGAAKKLHKVLKEHGWF